MSDHDMWRVGRVRDFGPGDELSPAELECDERTIGEMTVGELADLIRERFTASGYTVVISATGAGWLAAACGVGGEVVHARVGATLEHALEALLGGDE